MEKQNWDQENLSDHQNFILLTGIIKATFNRVPGMLVALFYCFCNSEVKSEFMQNIKAYETGREIELEALRRRSTISNSQAPSRYEIQRINSNRLNSSQHGSIGDMHERHRIATDNSINYSNNPYGNNYTIGKGSSFGANSVSNPEDMRRSSILDKSLWLRSFFHPIMKSSHKDSMRRSSEYHYPNSFQVGSRQKHYSGSNYNEGGIKRNSNNTLRQVCGVDFLSSYFLS